MYLVHAWAKSRAGFNARLTVHRLSPDGRRVLDEGDARLRRRRPSSHDRGPEALQARTAGTTSSRPPGGVKTGWQTVLRSRNVLRPLRGPDRARPGRHRVNGPHQGAWIDDSDGRRLVRCTSRTAAPRPRRPPAADVVARRLARHRRRPRRRRTGRAGRGMGQAARNRRAARGHAPTGDEFDDDAPGPAVAVAGQPRCGLVVAHRETGGPPALPPCRTPGPQPLARASPAAAEVPRRPRSWPPPAWMPARCASGKRRASW